MLTYEDCLDMCDLSQDEIYAIAEHEHIDRLQAVATAEFLTHCEGGERKIRRMIIDDIRRARMHGHKEHERELKRAFTHFVKTHPNHSRAAH